MVALILSQTYHAQGFYIHSLDCLDREWRNDTIRKEYENAVSVRDLANKWTLSQRWVEDIIGRPNSGETGKQLMLLGQMKQILPSLYFQTKR